jgi:hypothetical protein
MPSSACEYTMHRVLLLKSFLILISSRQALKCTRGHLACLVYSCMGLLMWQQTSWATQGPSQAQSHLHCIHQLHVAALGGGQIALGRNRLQASQRRDNAIRSRARHLRERERVCCCDRLAVWLLPRFTWLVSVQQPGARSLAEKQSSLSPNTHPF